MLKYITFLSLCLLFFVSHIAPTQAQHVLDGTDEEDLNLDEHQMHPEPIIILQGLDKITARTSKFAFRVGETVDFGSLKITAHSCQVSDPMDPPESAALLEIHEQKKSQLPKSVFQGWMFASSPALSSLEHPIYDIWVIDCKSDNKQSPSVGS